MSSLNKQTVNTVADILSFHATPVSIASGLQNATKGEVIDTSLAAANAVQSFGAIMSKTLANLAPPLLAANLVMDGAKMSSDATRLDGKYSDATLTSAASNITAAAAYAATLAAGGLLAPATALALAAAGITASAALGVAALSQNPNSTAHHDQINQVLGKAMDLAAQTGGGIEGYFARQANSLESGISRFYDAMSGGFLDFAFGLGDAINGAEDALIAALQDKYDLAHAQVSPLILDLDGDGVETLGKAAGIHFDHDGNGFAELTGWVGKDDGLLVFDRNGNGQIDTGAELFGNNTVLANGRKAANGFEALKELDANRDGKMDASDAAYSNLRIWIDADSDGITDAGELLTLTEAGVKSLNTGYANQSLTDAQGNQHLQTGRYTRADGTTARVDDVWFVADTARTVDKDLVAVSADVAALPDLAGFGNVHSLHQSMARDVSGELQSLVVRYSQATNISERETLTQQILYKWSGADRYSAKSRGGYLDDGRIVYVVEAFMGQAFLPSAGTNAAPSKPGPNAASVLIDMYADILKMVGSGLAAQTHLRPLYDGIGLTWDQESDKLDLDISSVVATLRAAYAADTSAGGARLLDFAANLKMMGKFGGEVLDKLRAAGNLSGTGFDFLLGHAGQTLVRGDSNADTLNGADGRDDVLLGMAGNDALNGNGGNDLLDGGAGNDYLSGGGGNDTYLFGRGDGQDTIATDYDKAAGKANVLQFKDGVAPADIIASRSGHDLILGVAGTRDRVTLQCFFHGDTPGNAFNPIQQAIFSDGTTWDVAALTAKAFEGTAAADTLNGTVNADSLYGQGGNDTLYGGGGDDTLDGGAGNDTLNGGAGNDTYLFGKGDGRDSIVYDYDYGTASNKFNTLQFKDGVAPGEITAARSGTDLVLSITGTRDRVTLQYFFHGDTPGNAFNPIQQAKFSDGTTWDVAALTAKAFEGTAAADTLNGTVNADSLYGQGGRDTLYGGGGDDTLDGGAGNDTLNGGLGNDTYLFNRGDGVDTWIDTDSTADNQDIARFGADINLDQLWLKRSGNNLEASIIGTTDKITIQNWYAGGANHIERFEAGGRALVDSRVDALVQAMAAFAPPGAGQTSLPDTYRQALAPVLAANWQ